MSRSHRHTPVSKAPAQSAKHTPTNEYDNLLSHYEDDLVCFADEMMEMRVNLWRNCNAEVCKQPLADIASARALLWTGTRHGIRSGMKPEQIEEFIKACLAPTEEK